MGRRNKSVSFSGPDDLDLLTWAEEQPCKFATLCKRGLRLVRCQGSPPDQGVDPRLVALVDRMVADRMAAAQEKTATGEVTVSSRAGV